METNTHSVQPSQPAVPLSPGPKRKIAPVIKLIFLCLLFLGIAVILKRSYLISPTQPRPISISDNEVSKISKDRQHLIQFTNYGLSFTLTDWAGTYYDYKEESRYIFFRDENEKQTYLECLNSLNNNCHNFAFSIQVKGVKKENNISLEQFASESAKEQFDIDSYRKPFVGPVKFQFKDNLGQSIGHIFYRNSYVRKNYSEQVNIAFLELNNTFYYIKIIYPGVDYDQMDQVLKSIKFLNEPTPTPKIKFTRESVLEPCNYKDKDRPLCSDSSYKCFISLMDGPCTMTVRGKVNCGDAKKIVGDNLCHHMCESNIDCSEGYYCGLIKGYAGDTGERYMMCFKK